MQAICQKSFSSHSDLMYAKCKMTAESESVFLSRPSNEHLSNLQERSRVVKYCAAVTKSVERKKRTKICSFSFRTGERKKR